MLRISCQGTRASSTATRTESQVLSLCLQRCLAEVYKSFAPDGYLKVFQAIDIILKVG
jgi:hypothetical protein